MSNPGEDSCGHPATAAQFTNKSQDLMDEALARTARGAVRENMLDLARRHQIPPDDVTWALFILAAQASDTASQTAEQMDRSARVIERFSSDIEALAREAGVRAGNYAAQSVESVLTQRAAEASKQTQKALESAAGVVGDSVQSALRRYQAAIERNRAVAEKQYAAAVDKALAKYVRQRVAGAKLRSGLVILIATLVCVGGLAWWGWENGNLILPQDHIRYDRLHGVVYIDGGEVQTIGYCRRGQPLSPRYMMPCLQIR